MLEIIQIAAGLVCFIGVVLVFGVIALWSGRSGDDGKYQ